MIYALYFGAIALAGLVQYSFLIFLPVAKYAIPVLVLCVFASVAHRPSVSLPVMAFGGFVIDWFSSTPMGYTVLIMALIWAGIMYSIRTFFTHLSLVSCMALCALSTALYSFLTWVLYLVLNIYGKMPIMIALDMRWLSQTAYAMCINAFLIGILFAVANKISKVFNFAFIDKR